jgi:hypothetical protein
MIFHPCSTHGAYAADLFFGSAGNYTPKIDRRESYQFQMMYRAPCKGATREVHIGTSGDQRLPKDGPCIPSVRVYDQTIKPVVGSVGIINTGVYN